MELVAMALILGAFFAAQYMVYQYIGLKNVEYTLTLGADEAYEGDEIEIIEEINNAKRLPLLWARSEIACSRYLTFKGQRFTTDSSGEQRGLISGIFVLKGYQKLRRTWKVRCEKRGLMRIDNAVITAGDLFGLAKLAMVADIRKTVRVLPLPSELETGDFSDNSFIGSMQVRRFMLPDPFMISGAREYTGREPMNRIHWQASARTGSLMIHSNEFTTERRVLIALNMQRRSRSYKTALTDIILEPQIKAAAAVLDFCSLTNASCAFAANTEKRTLVSEGEGFEHSMDILRKLAEIDNLCGERFDEMLSALNTSAYTDLIVITPFLSERISDEIERFLGTGGCCKILTAGFEEGEEFLPPACETIFIRGAG